MNNAVLEAPTALPGRFRSVEKLMTAGVDQQNTRAFVGDGSEILAIPHCIGVSSIRIGMMPLPEYEDREYVVDASGRKTTVREPLWKVEALPDGTPIVLRGLISNDGIWQAGANIYVTGEWDTKAEEKAKADAAKKN